MKLGHVERRRGSGGQPPGQRSPHEEDPVAFPAELINWLKDPEPDR
ncbi:hypothetical protein [Streptomyces sp. HUAS ZL42]